MFPAGAYVVKYLQPIASTRSFMSTLLSKSGSTFSLLSCLVVASGSAAWSASTANPHAAKPTSAVCHAGSTASSTKSKKYSKKATLSHKRRSAWLIPPPPAYMPSILPELMVRHAAQPAREDVANEEDKKPENPYKKYIYTPSGSVPEPVQTRKGVATWSQRT